VEPADADVAPDAAAENEPEEKDPDAAGTEETGPEDRGAPPLSSDGV